MSLATCTFFSRLTVRDSITFFASLRKKQRFGQEFSGLPLQWNTFGRWNETALNFNFVILSSSLLWERELVNVVLMLFPTFCQTTSRPVSLCKWKRTILFKNTHLSYQIWTFYVGWISTALFSYVVSVIKYIHQVKLSGYIILYRPLIFGWPDNIDDQLVRKK